MTPVFFAHTTFCAEDERPRQGRQVCHRAGWRCCAALPRRPRGSLTSPLPCANQRNALPTAARKPPTIRVHTNRRIRHQRGEFKPRFWRFLLVCFAEILHTEGGMTCPRFIRDIARRMAIPDVEAPRSNPGILLPRANRMRGTRASDPRRNLASRSGHNLFRDGESPESGAERRVVVELAADVSDCPVRRISYQRVFHRIARCRLHADSLLRVSGGINGGCSGRRIFVWHAFCGTIVCHEWRGRNPTREHV